MSESVLSKPTTPNEFPVEENKTQVDKQTISNELMPTINVPETPRTKIKFHLETINMHWTSNTNSASPLPRYGCSIAYTIHHCTHRCAPWHTVEIRLTKAVEMEPMDTHCIGVVDALHDSTFETSSMVGIEAADQHSGQKLVRTGLCTQVVYISNVRPRDGE